MSFKINESHWEILLSFLEEHKDLAMGRVSGPNGRERQKKLWQEITLKLNSLGAGERSYEKWQKTWVDFKYQLKKKASVLQEELTVTGGGQAHTAPFNKYERRALFILGNSFYKGVGSTEVGVSRNKDNAMEPTVIFRREGGETPHSVDVEAQSLTLDSLVAGPSGMQNTSASYNKEEHSYCYQPPPLKKRRNDDLSSQYAETVALLRDIKTTLDTRLAAISDNLSKLVDVLRSNDST